MKYINVVNLYKLSQRRLEVNIPDDFAEQLLESMIAKGLSGRAAIIYLVGI
ncbi:hypothetical protein KD050_11650 [Psychrobacillus sp. INOP01]|uniref:hypothetical protein n=1 Tax=Psychrobacillus sp. INOP01 TaxID=2829187 RepID=UPI001BA4ABD5|nr:hypothetical protein [Psychrobacillus sp. INOP01]QUG39976.1 hypothetical protein KD050_11650 [Psychrobacillus sp. INOP01]